MAYSTPQAILLGISKLIAAQAPAADDHGGCFEFEPRSEATTWEKVADSDKDRRFTVDGLTRDQVTMFGAVSELDCVGTFNVTIMHQVTDDENEGIARRDADLSQIKNAMDKSVNVRAHLTGVSHIRSATQSIQRPEKKFWKSLLQFTIYYSLAAP